MYQCMSLDTVVSLVMGRHHRALFSTLPCYKLFQSRQLFMNWLIITGKYNCLHLAWILCNFALKSNGITKKNPVLFIVFLAHHEDGTYKNVLFCDKQETEHSYCIIVNNNKITTCICTKGLITSLCPLCQLRKEMWIYI